MVIRQQNESGTDNGVVILKDFSKIVYLTGFILLVPAFFLSNVDIVPQHSFISVFFIVFLAIPCFLAVFVWLGNKKGLLLLIIMGLYALFLETMAIITGIPYSEFYYTEIIGAKLFGTTPFTVPFAWLPLFIGSMYLASEIRINGQRPGPLQIAILTTLLLLLADLVLDPAAVALQFWIWKEPGIFYGVPLMNFIGWVISGFVAAVIGVVMTRHELREDKPAALASSLLLIMFFWTGVCVYMKLLIPAFVGIAMIAFITWSTKGHAGNFDK
ncbi:MAG: carotenoid biosynthesis protein [Methanolobus sp.]|nr:carotenoid biosynthesis protein [Methanolobus sp.]